MLKTLLLLFISIFLLSAKAQKIDTTVYQGCKVANDTTTYIGQTRILNADSCPQFKNGDDDFYKFINTRKRYPIRARKNHI